MSSNGEHTPKAIADELCKRFTFKTMRDNKDLFYYADGTYVPDGERIIETEVENRMGAKATNHYVREVIGHVQRLTFVERAFFDRNPHHVNLINGVFDLNNSSLKSHAPEQYYLSKLPVTYYPENDCPRIKKFLQEVLAQGDIEVVQELIGYLLIKDYRFQKMFIFLGEGANGKSVLLSIIRLFLGQKNTSAVSPHELISDRFACAELYGKRANICADISHEALRDTSKLKMLTGGDPIRAQRKFKPPFDFVNYAKILGSANRLPQINDDSDASFRRIIIVRFPNTFSQSEANPNLLAELTTEEELSGLLNWAIQGARRLLTNGQFSNSKSTADIRKTYQRLSNPVRSFINDCIEFDNFANTFNDDLYSAYTDYCKLHRIPIYPNNTFGKKIRSELGDHVLNTQLERKRGLIGIKLKHLTTLQGIQGLEHT